MAREGSSKAAQQWRHRAREAETKRHEAELAESFSRGSAEAALQRCNELIDGGFTAPDQSAEEPVSALASASATPARDRGHPAPLWTPALAIVETHGSDSEEWTL